TRPNPSFEFSAASRRTSLIREASLSIEQNRIQRDCSDSDRKNDTICSSSPGRICRMLTVEPSVSTTSPSRNALAGACLNSADIIYLISPASALEPHCLRRMPGLSRSGRRATCHCPSPGPIHGYLVIDTFDPRYSGHGVLGLIAVP